MGNDNNKKDNSSSSSSPLLHPGTTLQILAIITGDIPLLKFCLESGFCNPNDQRFLMEDLNEHNHHQQQYFSSSNNTSNNNKNNTNDNTSGAIMPCSSSSSSAIITLRNGYSPFFVACLCEQIEC